VKPLTIVLPDLESTGPILDVQLGNSPTGQRALRQHGQAVPAPVSVRALIDTGSDMCALGGLQLLIGRDLLAKTHFAYDGLGNSFTLTV